MFIIEGVIHPTPHKGEDYHGPEYRESEVEDLITSLIGRKVYNGHKYDKPVGRLSPDRSHYRRGPHGDVIVKIVVDDKDVQKEILKGNFQGLSIGSLMEKTPSNGRYDNLLPYEVSICDQGALHNTVILSALDTKTREEIYNTRAYVNAARNVPHSVKTEPWKIVRVLNSKKMADQARDATLATTTAAAQAAPMDVVETVIDRRPVRPASFEGVPPEYVNYIQQLERQMEVEKTDKLRMLHEAKLMENQDLIDNVCVYTNHIDEPFRNQLAKAIVDTSMKEEQPALVQALYSLTGNYKTLRDEYEVLKKQKEEEPLQRKKFESRVLVNPEERIVEKYRLEDVVAQHLARHPIPQQQQAVVVSKLNSAAEAAAQQGGADAGAGVAATPLAQQIRLPKLNWGMVSAATSTLKTDNRTYMG